MSKFLSTLKTIQEAVEAPTKPTTPTKPDTPPAPSKPFNPIRKPAPGRKAQPKASAKEFFDSLKKKYNL
jgi:hypothetical protein